MAQQTAVEWLSKKTFIPVYFLEQAKAMEKEQIMDAWDNGCEDDGIIDNAEDYYNETFNTKNQ